MKLRGQEKWLLGACGALVYGTGACLGWSARWLRSNGPFGEEPHSLEAMARVGHSAGGFVALVALGYLLKGHILPGWRARRRRPSGAAMCGILLFLTVTGFGLLYGGEAWHDGAANTGHTVMGLGAMAPLFWHMHRRGHKASQPRPSRPIARVLQQP